MVERQAFLMKPNCPNVKKNLFLWNQSINVIYLNKKNKLMVSNLEKGVDYLVNLCLPQLPQCEKEAFLMKPKHQRHSSQWEEWVYGAQSKRKGDYLMNLCQS